jgi:type III secretory pathway component EscS
MFVVTGALLGVLVGVVAGVVVGVPPQDQSLSLGTLIRYFAAILGLLGAVVGAAVALFAERRRR